MGFKMKGNPLKMGTMATKSTMKMAKDPAMKMAKDPAMNFNTKLKQASADGKLSGEFKEAVDNAPLNKAKTPAKKAPMKKAALKKGTYADAVKKDPKLPEYIKLQKSLKKGSTEWNKNQNKINIAYGDPTRHGGGTQSKAIKPVQGKDDEAPKNKKVIKSSVYVPVERNKKKTVELDDEGKRTGNKSVTVTDDQGKVVRQKDVKVDPNTGDRTKTVTKSDSTRKTKRKSYREAVKAWRDGGKQGDKPKRKDYMRA